jgi:hypothetical protein
MSLFRDFACAEVQYIGNEGAVLNSSAIQSTIVFGEYDPYKVAIAHSKAFGRYIGWGVQLISLKTAKGTRDN